MARALLDDLRRLLRVEAVDLEPGHPRPDRSQHLTQRIDPSAEHAPILKKGYDSEAAAFRYTRFRRLRQRPSRRSARSLRAG